MIRLVTLFSLLFPLSSIAQTTFDVREIADYRLTAPTLGQVRVASRLIATAMRANPDYTNDPLFTREVMVADDVVEAAGRLHARLLADPALTAALRTANLSAREYTRFVLALGAARLAHGFVESGALRSVPPGVTADNVAFVRAHETEIAAILAELGVP